MSKYKSRGVMLAGLKFDSQKEARRYIELKEMQDAGEITELRLQVPFELIPTQRTGEKTERATKYVADFTYKVNGELVVEDVKGYRKGAAYNLFTIKRKLMLYRYGIAVQEV